VPFKYEPTTASFPINQGDIILNLLEILPIISEKDIPELNNEGKVPPVIRRSHPAVVVITQDCDLKGDWEFRTQPANVKKDDRDERKLQEHVQLCDLFQKKEIRFQRGFNSSLWERVPSNQDERYHFFKSASIRDSNDDTLPDLYVDFKRTFSVPTSLIYSLISSGFAIRKARFPDPYRLDMIHRLFSYLSRIAVPTDQDMV